MKEEERKYWKDVLADLTGPKKIKPTKAKKALSTYRAVAVREGTIHLVYNRNADETADNIIAVYALRDLETFWRVPIKCRGVYKDYVTVEVPLWDNKLHDNRILTYKYEEMPEGLKEVLQLGTTFYAEVPKILHLQAEFVVKNVEIPNDAKTVEDSNKPVEEPSSAVG